MKAIATIILVLFIGVSAQANTTAKEVKVATIEMSIVTDIVIKETVQLEKTTEVARLYRRKNSMVKKALAFTTKRNRPKMA